MKHIYCQNFFKEIKTTTMSEKVYFSSTSVTRTTKYRVRADNWTHSTGQK